MLKEIGITLKYAFYWLFYPACITVFIFLFFDVFSKLICLAILFTALFVSLILRQCGLYFLNIVKTRKRNKKRFIYIPCGNGMVEVIKK